MPTTTESPTAAEALDMMRELFGSLVGALNAAARDAQRAGYTISYKVGRIQSPGRPDCPLIAVAVEPPKPAASDELPIITDPSEFPGA